MDENRKVLRTLTTESYTIVPAEHKALRNTTTGTITTHPVVVSSKAGIDNYEEIDN